ncbi:MAG: NAD-dependent epimerase/dehydratase [Candidatus Magnetoglobus multicellularis str. Araruama]|uniref:NAD-dependent epimerase/dehydratase n=1 Tax=Candidatus Magnetoglobus multicellularis str. Araruama TaxID=890399 RepID=A0A1V1P3M9_9BACT|nr:MAG: NAD-dependent epimerase/dehydratase [Candidatus Magnetoglobus multicellularis str. Araruama]
MSNQILVTGAAGFIGFHLCRRLLDNNRFVIGIDNLNDYYDVNLKKDRLAQIASHDHFTFCQADLADATGMNHLFATHNIDIVVNLAAQAGVRYSLINPDAYVRSNLTGFVNLLECAQKKQIRHFVFASSSSVYGANTHMPFSVHDNVDHPVSLYAATKKANELLAHSYCHIYNLPCTGLRFFTVYGPWGRPDMALFLFTRAIYEGKPINIFNHGKMKRDFTYIDDIIEGVVRIIDKIPEPDKKWSGDTPDPGTSYGPYRIYNIGNNSPVQLMQFIEILESIIGKTALKNFMDLQTGDVPATYANIDDLYHAVGFKPRTDIKTGIQRFVKWYQDYYHVHL